jgi:preprotein translocase subunit SecA
MNPTGASNKRAAVLPFPGILWGRYPEHRPAAQTWLPEGRYRRKLVPAAAATHTGAGSAFAARLARLRAGLARRQLTDALIAESFALIAECFERETGMTPFDTQFVAARIMLDNRLAEMATGEGKSIAALIAAATAALAGVPVHVITSNDYLAARDAAAMRAVYTSLGLRVGVVTQELDAGQRRAAYACDITYCTAKELVFDYLRDSLSRRGRGSELEQRAARLDTPAAAPVAPLVLRGLCMAIIDEADSILIDEAKVPLILSQAHGNSGERGFYEYALRVAGTLAAGLDYRFEPEGHAAQLTSAGRAKLGSGGGTASNWRHREESVCLALAALHKLQRDRDYLVRGGRVLIIEPTTGRVAPGRAWSQGLQQLVELKEGCAPSARPVTVAQITYQRFFPRYLRLAGLSGTATEARAELRAVYGLDVIRVPLRTPSRRELLVPRLYVRSNARWDAVVARTALLQRDGRPVLIGTGSVRESEQLSRRLDAAAVPHVVLNARHDAHEARIIEEAGRQGRVTVATNMAGRGTDIALGPGVAERGGLHVLLCQYNASRRIDRQFLGRCARRGEPGSGEILLAFDALPVPAWASALLQRVWRTPQAVLPHWPARWMVAVAAWFEDRRHRAQRKALCAEDAEIEQRLGPQGYSS